MKKLIAPITTITLIVLLIYSCRKAEIDTETQSAQDNSIAENVYDDIFGQTNRIAIGDPGVKQGTKRPSSNKEAEFTGSLTCGTINILTQYDSVTQSYPFPFEFEIDFGNGCYDVVDGKFRTGKIKASFSNYWDSVGTTLTITLENYYVNNMNIQGTIIVTNNGNYSYSENILNGKCIASTWDIAYKGSHTYTWITGYNTDTIATDDVLKITGSSSGVNRKGKSFTTKIVKPFIKDMTCQWIQEGVFEITPEGLSTRSVDFGDGTCDNKATVTINGNIFDFELN